MLVGSVILKEKLVNQEELPLLSARDFMDFSGFQVL